MYFICAIKNRLRVGVYDNPLEHQFVGIIGSVVHKNKSLYSIDKPILDYFHFWSSSASIAFCTRWERRIAMSTAMSRGITKNGT